MTDKEISFFEEFGKVFLTVLIIVSIFELGLIAFAYFNADEVNCNWLWCEFTTTTSEERSVTIINQKCLMNGIETNCSNLEVNWAVWGDPRN